MRQGDVPPPVHPEDGCGGCSSGRHLTPMCTALISTNEKGYFVLPKCRSGGCYRVSRTAVLLSRQTQ